MEVSLTHLIFNLKAVRFLVLNICTLKLNIRYFAFIVQCSHIQNQKVTQKVI